VGDESHAHKVWSGADPALKGEDGSATRRAWEQERNRHPLTRGGTNFIDGWKLPESWSNLTGEEQSKWGINDGKEDDPEAKHGVPEKGYFSMRYITPGPRAIVHEYRNEQCKCFLVGTVL
jgi:hypothetical protein